MIEQKIAVAAGAYYLGTALDDTRFIVYAMPAPGVALERLDAAVDSVLAEFVADGVDEARLDRAKTRLVADAIYAQDSQATLARWYGSALATGETSRMSPHGRRRIEAVDGEAVRRGRARWLDAQARRHRLPAAAAEAEAA